MLPYLQNLLDHSCRLDVVNDVYRSTSLKQHVRGIRGTGGGINRVQNLTKLPKDWHSFLRNDNNKTLLVKFLAEEVIRKIRYGEKEVYFTYGDEVHSTPTGDTESLKPCNHEEADSRIFFHTENASRSGSYSFMIRTNDRDGCFVLNQAQ